MAFAAVITPQDRRLNLELQVKFKRLHDKLAKENLLPVIDHLFAEGVISEDVQYKLAHAPNEREQSRELLSVLHNSQHPLAFVEVYKAMVTEEAYIPILEQLDELKVCMAEPYSGTEHSPFPELNDYIRRIFPKMGSVELHELTAHLRSLGVDEIEDMRKLKESHLTGFMKPIRIQNLLDAIADERMKPPSASRVISQKQTEEQQLAETTSTTVVQKQTEEERKVQESEHEQRTPAANNESTVMEYRQMEEASSGAESASRTGTVLTFPTSQSRSIDQNQTDSEEEEEEEEEQQPTEPTTKACVPEQKDVKTKVKVIVHNQPKPTANKESKVRQYRQIVPRVVHTLPWDESVLGVTSLDDELYVLRDKNKEQVDVYNTTTTTDDEEEKYRLVRRLSLPGVKVRDMTSCRRYRCLYIAGSNSCVHRVELNGKITKFSVDYGPESLSVTSQFNVLVTTSHRYGELLELSTEGKQLRVLNLHDIGYPCHAIKLSSGLFVVCHGGTDDYVQRHRVCIVDTKGHVRHSYGADSATVGRLNEPCHLAVDKDKFIFVADYHNSRVLLLSPTLSFVREIVSRDQLKGRPDRLFLDVDRRRLYVAAECRVVVVQL